MEYLENEENKGVYWIIFFLFIIVIIILGYYFVFEKGVNNKTSNNEIEEEKQEEKIDDYIGIWKTKDDDGEIISDYELTIIKVDGTSIIFDLKLSDEYIYNNQFGDLEENRASFDVDKDGVKISGELSFKDNRIYLSVLSSSEEDVPVGTIRFDNKE